MGTKVPAAAHTLNILKLMIGNAAPLTAARIAAELNLPRSTTYQILAEMVAAGFVVHLPEQRRYGLGAVAYSMAQAYTDQQPIVRASAKHMRVLADQAQGSAHLSRLSELEVSYLLEERASGAVSLITNAGVRLPALKTASGRAMLAALTDTEIKARLDAAGLGQSWRTVKNVIHDVREQGWAAELEEVSVGQRSFAVAVVDHAGRPAVALAITCAVSRWNDQQLQELLMELQARAAMVQSHLFGVL